MKELKVLACQNCGHQWLPKRRRSGQKLIAAKKPKVCPVCKSTKWER